MYGDLAQKLILEAKRTQSLAVLPAYQEDLVNAIIRETKDLQRQSNELTSDLQRDRVKECQLFVIQLCMRRNKRCLLAYQKMRTERLDQMIWNNEEILNNSGNITLENLSYNEQEYLKRYDNLISEFKGIMPELELSGSLEPPVNVFIDVRVLKDAGEIQTEYGVFNLTKDSQFFVRQADVERLIQQGYLKKL